ncbi:hypothetical protein HU230_0012365 [Bradyrhizobium quebecense]|uniref:hypothetical protein n=1 Tax=Bradyrhizobium quebecense TaxID=2748629 RepID=UPI001F30E4A9|nr:hypothetical protein [Bradyrhizobium quebecense]UGA46782.1 hypothetical protein HU230_0012365 [Bradyrhizobium quebecense]
MQIDLSSLARLGLARVQPDPLVADLLRGEHVQLTEAHPCLDQDAHAQGLRGPPSARHGAEDRILQLGRDYLSALTVLVLQRHHWPAHDEPTSTREAQDRRGQREVPIDGAIGERVAALIARALLEVLDHFVQFLGADH